MEAQSPSLSEVPFAFTGIRKEFGGNASSFTPLQPIYVQWSLQPGLGVKGTGGYRDVNGIALSICVSWANATGGPVPVEVSGGASSVAVADGDGGSSWDVPSPALKGCGAISGDDKKCGMIIFCRPSALIL